MNSDVDLKTGGLAQQGDGGTGAWTPQGDWEAEALAQQERDKISRNLLWRGSQEDVIVDVRRLWW